MSPVSPIDEVDRQILDAIQRAFPVCERPYHELGQVLDLDEEDIHRRVVALRREGVVRRLGPLFDSRKLGFQGHLAAAKVATDAIDRVADVLRDCGEVTHNYLRAGTFNVWFTVTVPREDRPERILDLVRRCPGVSAVHVFPTARVFKLNTTFRVGGRSGDIPGEARHPERPRAERGGVEGSGPTAEETSPLSDADRRIVAALQAGLSESLTPWRDVAGGVGMDVAALIAWLSWMADAGIVRGVRAVLDQRRLGIAGNVLVAWRIEEGLMEDVGTLFAERAEVTHCVKRPGTSEWPFNLYTMIHAADEAACEEIIAAMSADAGVTDFVRLTTLRELKKTAPRYF